MANACLIRIAAFTACAALLAAATPAAAQCRLCPPPGGGPNKPPPVALAVQVEAGIDFSRMGLVVNGQGGTAAIDPLTGQRTLSAGLVDLRGMPVQGAVTIRGEPNEQVAVDFPGDVTLTNASGGSIRMTAITTSLKKVAKLDRNGTLSFTFGGRLLVDGVSDGDFRGRVPITVEYR